MKKFLDEFKQFISKGNVLYLAVGVIIGGAFSKIVSSLVDNIIMPIIGVILGGVDFSGLSITFQGASIKYGLFIQNVVDFLIVAFCIFTVIKILNSFDKKIKSKIEKEQKEQEEKEVSKEDVLHEIKSVNDVLKDPDVGYEEKGMLIRTIVDQIVWDKENNKMYFDIIVH